MPGFSHERLRINVRAKAGFCFISNLCHKWRS
jgi:hypothetical protein